jgi:Cdc6-like AAA superfamily ATPase
MIDSPQVFGDGYIPNIVGRESEKQALETALKPIARGKPSFNCLLHGPTGVGKTATTRYMLAELSRAGGQFQSTYVSCLSNTDRRSIIETVAESVFASPSRAQSLSRSRLLREMRSEIDAPFVVVLDEADYLGKDSRTALYDLYETAQVSVILIVNDRTAFLGNLRDRIHSRYAAAREIHFDKYSEGELAKIVEGRAGAGLRAGAVDDQAVQTIAAVADNARAAVQILQTAARSALDDRITPEDVVEAVPDAREMLRDRALSRLGDRHRYVFGILDNRGPMRAGEITDRYADVVGEELSQSTQYRVLSKLEEYDCITSEGATSGKQYRVREIPGGVPEIPV